MITKRLEEKFEAGHTNQETDMWFHFPLLRDIARDCNAVVELGTRQVVSTWALMMGLAGRTDKYIAISEDRKKLILNNHHALWSYDIFNPEDEYGIDLNEIAEIALENGVMWEFKHEDTLKCEIPPCDLIFFDTDHNYKQLSQELKLHANKARKYLVFHDTTHYAVELVPAINEFLEENEEWCILNCENACNGLTILVKVSVDKVEGWFEEHANSVPAK